MEVMQSQGILLGVNVDHCATLRQARYRETRREAGLQVEPDPVLFAQLAEQAGADGITMHLREDKRHVQIADVHRARAVIATRLNLEMACTKEMTEFALELKPEAVCLVPENRREVTTEGGLDLAGQQKRIQSVAEALTAGGIEVSLFIDPDEAAIEIAAEIGAPVVELHTGAFANAYNQKECKREFQRLLHGAQKAHALGLIVNMGHGINYQNIRMIRTLPHLHELNIGHTILSRSMFVGVHAAVREMKALMNPHQILTYE
jgi:pyridoxine 5-phosphate synthase